MKRPAIHRAPLLSSPIRKEERDWTKAVAAGEGLLIEKHVPTTWPASGANGGMAAENAVTLAKI